jgi:hypothetical protein
MISITAIATIATTTTIPNQMKCQSKSAINLIPANPVNQNGICSKADTNVTALGQRQLAALPRHPLNLFTSDPRVTIQKPLNIEY